MPFDDAPHIPPPRPNYRDAQGQKVPSVTTIISVTSNKAALVGWANRLGFEGKHADIEQQRLAGVGSLVHEWIAAAIGGPPSNDANYTAAQRDIALVCWQAWLAWQRHNRIQSVTLCEASLVHPSRAYGGTIDALVWIDGRHVAIDWKTANGFWPDQLIQLAAYHELAIAHGHQVDEVRIVRLPKDGGRYEEVIIPADQLFEAGWAFEYARRMYVINDRLKGQITAQRQQSKQERQRAIR